jgi:hypothetical protein
MKTKVFNKKLILKKSTVAKLNIPEMAEFLGGMPPRSPLTICDTCNTYAPCYTLQLQCV